MTDPLRTDPGSAEARAAGCICDPQDPRAIGNYCKNCQADRPPDGACPRCGSIDAGVRRAFQVEPHCPVHGLAEMKAYLKR